MASRQPRLARAFIIFLIFSGCAFSAAVLYELVFQRFPGQTIGHIDIGRSTDGYNVLTGVVASNEYAVSADSSEVEKWYESKGYTNLYSNTTRLKRTICIVADLCIEQYIFYDIGSAGPELHSSTSLRWR